MAMIKRALLQAEEPLAHIVAAGESTKVAGVMGASQKFIATLQPHPKFTYVLVNALGYSEFFGANSNTDYYGHNPHLDFNGLLHSWPGIGEDIEADVMKGKAWPYGYPCFYGATAYAHHKNTDPSVLGFGDVVFACANPHMKRVELVIRVFNEEAAAKGHSRILDKIRAGERTDVSMGCRVPFDLCSICTDWKTVQMAMSRFDPTRHRHVMISVLEHHRKVAPIRGLAITTKDHCDCMSKRRGQTLPNGQKVFVYNDAPRFFDISFVWVGADRTARVMWHMGEATAPATSPMKVASMPLTYTETLSRIEIPDSVLEKTSSMVKEIPGGLVTAIHRDADSSPDLKVDFLRGSGETSASELIATLSGLGIVLKPQEFQTIVLAASTQGQDFDDALRNRGTTFDTEVEGIDDTFGVKPDDFSHKLAAKLAPHMSERSAFGPLLEERLTRLSSMNPTPWQTDNSPMLEKLAQQYNGYRVSLLEQAENILPKVAHVLPGAPTKTASLAPLLLAAGPMVHLLSAHLRKNKGSSNPVSNFVANNPTFSTLVTVGGLMRAAMAIKSGGAEGLLRAVGKSLIAKSLISKAKDILL